MLIGTGRILRQALNGGLLSQELEISGSIDTIDVHAILILTITRQSGEVGLEYGDIVALPRLVVKTVDELIVGKWIEEI